MSLPDFPRECKGIPLDLLLDCKGINAHCSLSRCRCENNDTGGKDEFFGLHNWIDGYCTVMAPDYDGLILVKEPKLPAFYWGKRRVPIEAVKIMLPKCVHSSQAPPGLAPPDDNDWLCHGIFSFWHSICSNKLAWAQSINNMDVAKWFYEESRRSSSGEDFYRDVYYPALQVENDGNIFKLFDLFPETLKRLNFFPTCYHQGFTEKYRLLKNALIQAGVPKSRFKAYEIFVAKENPRHTIAECQHIIKHLLKWPLLLFAEVLHDINPSEFKRIKGVWEQCLFGKTVSGAYDPEPLQRLGRDLNSHAGSRPYYYSVLLRHLFTTQAKAVLVKRESGSSGGRSAFNRYISACAWFIEPGITNEVLINLDRDIDPESEPRLVALLDEALGCAHEQGQERFDKNSIMLMLMSAAAESIGQKHKFKDQPDPKSIREARNFYKTRVAPFARSNRYKSHN